MEFNPPMSARSTLELIDIAHGSEKNWQREAIDAAKQELINRNVTDEYQQSVLDRWEEYEHELDEQIRIESDLHAQERYSIGFLAAYVFIFPMILALRVHFDESLYSLKQGNYIIKYQQKKTARLIAIIAWTVLFIVLANI